MTKGYLSLVLHAHLPYVRHPEFEEYLEEKWFFEAMAETYIPLVDMFDRLVDDNIPFCITMTLTPTLLSMMDDQLLRERFLSYLYKLMELSEKEVQRTKNMYQVSEVTKMYRDKLKRILHIYRDKYHGNIIDAFRKYKDIGCIELLASAATHGYLPLYEEYPEALNAQIQQGINTYKRYFGNSPKGFWLPECGYTPVLDEILIKHNIYYFICESHGIEYAVPRPEYGTYAPICSPRGVVAFGRDQESSKQVWSMDEGYPGDYDYRDFYRDIGYDLDYEYIKPYILPNGQRTHTGLKYYKITGKTEDKHIYIPENAIEKASIHAANFIFNRQQQIKYYSGGMTKPPIVVCPYDAELFGHWWFEGVDWLNFVIRKSVYDQNIYTLITPFKYLERYPKVQVAQPCPSSWGYQGYNEVWLNGSNDWIYRHIHKSVQRMTFLANRAVASSPLVERALNQAAREVMLAQSSDWAFIMKTGTMVEYAKNRTLAHLGRFNRLYHDISNNCIDENWLRDIEYIDNIFPDMDYSMYKSLEKPLPGISQALALSL